MKEIGKHIVRWVWSAAVTLSVLYVVWHVVIVFFVATFTVPSGSMEPTLVPGDRVIVSKMCYGARIWDLRDSVCHGVITRLWGYGEPERGDVMVFNMPYPHDRHHISFDYLKYFVKRCVALPGDTFEIRKGHYHVRGVDGPIGNVRAQETVEMLTKDSASIARLGREYGAFPRRRFIPWTIREMGPFYVPKAGDTIEVNRDNMLLYGTLIEWEIGKRIENRGDTLYLVGGKPIRSHVMEQNCYFMAGDNAPGSVDSRYWGLVPEEHIVGKVTRLLWSFEPYGGRLRWERVMKGVE